MIADLANQNNLTNAPAFSSAGSNIHNPSSVQFSNSSSPVVVMQPSGKGFSDSGHRVTTRQLTTIDLIKTIHKNIFSGHCSAGSRFSDALTSSPQTLQLPQALRLRKESL